MDAAIPLLLKSTEPSVRYKILTGVMNCQPDSPDMRDLRETIRQSPRVQGLLVEQTPEGRIPHGAYDTWYGAHWVLNLLADLDYPANDEALRPLRDQVLEWLFSDPHVRRIKQVTIAGRVRMCASLEGNAIYYLLKLGLADDRIDALVERLLSWQWPDGGWNCDKNPDVQQTSSFMESLIPLRGLNAYARQTGSPYVRSAVEQAAEVFLKRHLFKRQQDGQIMNPNFVRLHYPWYWHYDLLFGLKVLNETGAIGDARCAEALDLLESKRLPDGGFPAEAKYYRVSDQPENGTSRVDWGGTSIRRLNPFVTAEALVVLYAAGRLSTCA